MDASAIRREQQTWSIESSEDDCLHHCFVLSGEDTPRSEPFLEQARTCSLAGVNEAVPLQQAQKRDLNRKGFFDLPAELRNHVYELITIQLLFAKPEGSPGLEFRQNSFLKTEDMIEAVYTNEYPISDPWAKYLEHVKASKLISRQFHREFIAVWAAAAPFKLPEICLYVSGRATKSGQLQGLHHLGSKVNSFLHAIGQSISCNIRCIQIPVEISCSYWRNNPGPNPGLRLFAQMSIEILLPTLEVSDDVHCDLRLEIMVRTQYLPRRLERKCYWRTFCFKQASIGKRSYWEFAGGGETWAQDADDWRMKYREDSPSAVRLSEDEVRRDLLECD